MYSGRHFWVLLANTSLPQQLYNHPCATNAMRPRYMSQVSTYVLGVVGNLLHLRVSLRCHGDARPMLLLLAVSGARKAVATDTALVHTARYARASRAIALETDGTTRPGTTKTCDPTEERPALCEENCRRPHPCHSICNC